MNARLLAPLLFLLLAGCGGGSQSAYVDPLPDLVGTWRGEYTYTEAGVPVGSGSAVIAVTPVGAQRQYHATLTPAGSGNAVVIEYISSNPQYNFWIGSIPGTENVTGKNGCSFTVLSTPGSPPALVVSMYHRGGYEHYRGVTYKD